jgi:triphosphoribosyl-dephospho-CoA synthetase
MTQGITKTDFTGMQTTGETLFVRHGITGIRGQAEAGFPALTQVGLPVLEAGLSRGLSLEEAGCAALLHLMCAITDTNLIARSDYETQQKIAWETAYLLRENPFPGEELLRKMDEAFREKNLSPGGSADLLALTFFLHMLQEDA